ncbi:MAG: phosphoribosylanthranilate isomerase [Bacteroidales bacterium]|nr:phosphoribosylanthranilate isomerase [Bacteroidales bacterium]
MIIKVCGMREPENIRAVEALGIDLMGFIFWPPSSRYVVEKPSYLPENCRRAGVFVDAALEDMLAAALDFRLDVLQLHGHETPEAIAALKERLPAVRIVKSLAVKGPEDLAQAASYEDVCDAFLFDTKGKLPGGNGQQFDWSVLRAYRGRLPFLLSGGIGPDDGARIRAFDVPGCLGIDLNSRFETAPGRKDVEALRTFIETVRQ